MTVTNCNEMEQAQTMDLCYVAILSHQLWVYHFYVNLVVRKMVFSDVLKFFSLKTGVLLFINCCKMLLQECKAFSK